MIRRKTIERLERMLDDAINGTFRESDYDESVLSRIETKWRQFLGASALSRENLEQEKSRVKTLVSDISHQTKTPMANIRLYVELLEERIEGSENRRILEEIGKQTEKLEFLIQSLTKLSRLETNMVEVKPEQQELLGLLSEALQDIRPKAERKGIKLRCLYEGGVSACYDKKWTKEALGNVLDNAVKYSPPGGKVDVSVEEYEMYAAVSVKDQGIGVREEDTAKIFQRFYRAEGLYQEEGSGIGLYLTREILKRENGYIKVKSRAGKGAEFVLFLQKNHTLLNTPSYVQPS